jgi:hypothetical protein
MTMDIAAESNVLDVKYPIADLAILFQGRDIEEGKSNLKILTIRVINDGESNIHEDDFDSRIPFGLQIDDGQVIRAQVVGGDSPYLSTNVHPRVEGSNRIVLDKIIFDKGKFVTLEILVLHPKNIRPRVRPVGKIAGLEEIRVTNSFESGDTPSFLSQVFIGSSAVQIARTIAYSIFALLSIMVLGFSIWGLASIPSIWRKRGRQRLARQIPALDSPEQERKRKAIEAIYLEHGHAGLSRARRILNDEAELRKVLSRHKRYHTGAFVVEATAGELRTVPSRTDPRSVNSISPLISAKLLSLRRGELTIDPDVRRLLADFVENVRRKDTRLS